MACFLPGFWDRPPLSWESCGILGPSPTFGLFSARFLGPSPTSRYLVRGQFQTILHLHPALWYNVGNTRIEVECVLLIDGKKYYKVGEAADLAQVNTRTLRRWIADGNLAHFLFPFRQTKSGPMYYRLEPPEEGDATWEGEAVYKMPQYPGMKARKHKEGDHGRERTETEAQ